MERRLTVATMLADGDVVKDGDARDLTSADEVVLMPPFSGG